MQPSPKNPPPDSTQSILTDPEIFDDGISKRLDAIFVSMGLHFTEPELDYYTSVIPQFIKDM